MKRMRFFAVISILLFSLVYGFNAPKQVLAQTQPTNTTSFTHQQAKDAMLPLFDNLISAVNADIQSASTLTSVAGKARYQQYQTTGPELITFVNSAKDLYNSSYDSSLSPADAQLKAIGKVQGLFNNQPQTLLSGINKIPGLKAIIDTFRSQVESARFQANEISQGRSAGNLTSNPSAITSAQAGVNKAVTTTDAPKKCQSIFTSSLSDCIDAGVAWIITHTLLAIAGWFLWVTATLMNYSISIGILQFAKWAPDTLYPIWIIIRQIVSLFVVFAGLWLGFMYIINRGDQFKKYIPWVVIFAIFVNFSYPLTRTAIDLSNIISLNLYASAVGTDALTASTVSISDDKTVGAIIRDRMGLIGLVDFATGETKSTVGTLNAIDSTPVALLAVMFIAYAAWIFFLVSALIITRTAVLIFLIVASPILFVDSVIPKLGEQAANLRKIFFEQLFVGPVFTIMLALTLKFLEVFQGSTSGVLRTSVGTTGGNDSIVMFFNILMMLIMLHIMLKVTKSTSGKIGEAVSGAMGKVGGFAVGGVALGGAGMLGRATLGRGAAALRDSKWVGGMQEKSGVAGFAGKHLFNASNSIATSGFDARNSSFVKTNAEKIGMKLSMGNSMGFKEREEKEAKEKSMRANFVRNSIKTRESRMREEYNSLGDDDSAIESKKKFLGNLSRSSDPEIKKLKDKLENEDRTKALKTYRDFEDTEEGRKKKEEFLKKYQAGGILEDKVTLAKLLEHDQKVKEGKDEKAGTKKYQEDLLKANQEIASALKSQASQFGVKPQAQTTTSNIPQGGQTTPAAPNTQTNQATPNYTQGNYQQPAITFNQTPSTVNVTGTKPKAPEAVPVNQKSANTNPQTSSTQSVSVAIDDFADIF